VARDIGVSGDAKAEELWRPAGDPYPMPPMKTFRNGEIWLKGFEAVGIRMAPAAVGMNTIIKTISERDSLTRVNQSLDKTLRRPCDGRQDPGCVWSWQDRPRHPTSAQYGTEAHGESPHVGNLPLTSR